MQTNKAVHIAVTNSKDGRISTSLERKIPLVTIRSIGISNLRDDWMVRFSLFGGIYILTKDPQTLNGPTVEEGDPIFSCYFKTELAANLLQLTQASITLLVGPTYVKSLLNNHLANVLKASNIPRRRTRKRRSSLSRMKRSQKTASTRATPSRWDLASHLVVYHALRRRGNQVLFALSHRANCCALEARLMYVV